jgi:hypothetical protein
MAASKNLGAAEAAVITRRDAIIGALALAAGALVATKPETAAAANGSAVSVGMIHAGTAPTVFWCTTTGNLGPTYSQAMIAGPNPSGKHRGLDGEVYALAGSAAVGVQGSASALGQYGVVANHSVAGGTALQVNGKAVFSRSGTGTIPKGSSYKTVTGLAGIGNGAFVLATLQGNPGTGVYLKFARRVDAGTIRVYLNKAAPNAVTFAWFILG